MKIGVCGFMMALLLACGDPNSDTMSANELVVERFVKSIKDYDTVIVANRVSFVRMQRGDLGQPLSVGDSVYFYFVARTLTDSIPYETNALPIARRYQMDTTLRNFEPIGVTLGKGDLIAGLDAGLQLGHVGDLAYIVFNSDLGYGGKPMGIVSPNSPLFFEVQILRKQSAK